MKILFFGDVVGRAGRDALASYLPELIQHYKPDVVIANGENAAHGFGISPQTADELFAMGIHVLTSGNHMWEKREIIPYINAHPALIRPLNYPEGTPGKGFYEYRLPDHRRLVVMNAMTRLFMETLDDPFARTVELMESQKLALGKDTYILMDLHGEASSEKQAFAHYFDGQMTAIIGTHTHVPTADLRILPMGTAYMTDAGMCGDYNSVTGFDPDIPILRFTRKMKIGQLAPATGPGTVCGAMIEINEATGLAHKVEAIKRGPL